MSGMLLEVERPDTLTHAVARSIAEAIVTGAFAPGQALPEVPVALQLGTSRGTVREALRVLADQGLVEIIRHRGAFVAAATPRKAREVFTLRAELEAFAVRLVFERQGYSDKVLASLEATLAALGGATVRFDIFQIVDLDMRFHDLLSAGCGNNELLASLASLRLRTKRFIVYTKLVDSDLEPDDVTHERLLEAIRSGNAEKAASEVRHHILAAGEQLVRKLVHQGPTGGSIPHEAPARPASPGAVA